MIGSISAPRPRVGGDDDRVRRLVRDEARLGAGGPAFSEKSLRAPPSPHAEWSGGAGWIWGCEGRPGRPGLAGVPAVTARRRLGCGDDPDPRPKMASSVAARSLRLRVLAEVEEDPLAPVHVGVQLLDEAPDRVQLLLARVDDQRVGAPLRHDERRAVGGAPRHILAGTRRAGVAGRGAAGAGGGGRRRSDGAGNLARARAEAAAREELVRIWATSCASACFSWMIWSSLDATSTSTSFRMSRSRRTFAATSVITRRLVSRLAVSAPCGGTNGRSRFTASSGARRT